MSSRLEAPPFEEMSQKKPIRVLSIPGDGPFSSGPQEIQFHQFFGEFPAEHGASVTVGISNTPKIETNANQSAEMLASHTSDFACVTVFCDGKQVKVLAYCLDFLYPKDVALEITEGKRVALAQEELLPDAEAARRLIAFVNTPSFTQEIGRICSGNWPMSEFNSKHRAFVPFGPDNNNLKDPRGVISLDTKARILHHFTSWIPEALSEYKRSDIPIHWYSAVGMILYAIIDPAARSTNWMAISSAADVEGYVSHSPKIVERVLSGSERGVKRLWDDKNESADLLFKQFNMQSMFGHMAGSEVYRRLYEAKCEKVYTIVGPNSSFRGPMTIVFGHQIKDPTRTEGVCFFLRTDGYRNKPYDDETSMTIDLRNWQNA